MMDPRALPPIETSGDGDVAGGGLAAAVTAVPSPLLAPDAGEQFLRRQAASAGSGAVHVERSADATRASVGGGGGGDTGAVAAGRAQAKPGRRPPRPYTADGGGSGGGSPSGVVARKMNATRTRAGRTRGGRGPPMSRAPRDFPSQPFAAFSSENGGGAGSLSDGGESPMSTGGRHGAPPSPANMGRPMRRPATAGQLSTTRSKAFSGYVQRCVRVDVVPACLPCQLVRVLAVPGSPNCPPPPPPAAACAPGSRRRGTPAAATHLLSTSPTKCLRTSGCGRSCSS